MALSCSKKLPALLRGITSKHHGDSYCLNCLYFFAENKRKSHKNVCENEVFCNIVMASETKTLKFNQYQKSDKVPFVIYADLKFLVEKTDWYKNNPENSFATKVGKHIPSSFWMSIIS